MDIGKAAATAGADLARIYGQGTSAEKTGETKQQECGECQPERRSTAGADRELVSISPEAQSRADRQEALQLAKEIYRQLPDARQEAVSRAKQRLSEGYYDKESVREELAERLTRIAKRLAAAAR
ncbi:MAG: flagellar biosynthesis anti-sigma factor FlgM [Candidatus Krumholzibacteriota bacterium]|nr:flagellar biosynthesis anti-sigma factor FlgM [Candidatus Krumholzibacteriota bacterium]